MSKFMFTAGPWNIHEGNETFGPGHRKPVPLEEKMKKFAEIGIASMQFHDDDAVPDMNNMTEKQIVDYAKDVKAMRTQPDEDCYRHLINSKKIFELLLEKVKRFDYEFQAACIQERNLEKLEMYVMELLMT